jgi:hypothetical protein
MALALTGPISGVFFAGNDYSWEFTVSLEGALVDLSGMTCRFVMARPGGFAPVISTEDTVPTAVATIGTPSTDGIFYISVSNADSADLLGTYEYQAQVENGMDHKSNILHGYFTFKQNLIA